MYCNTEATRKFYLGIVNAARVIVGKTWKKRGTVKRGKTWVKPLGIV